MLIAAQKFKKWRKEVICTKFFAERQFWQILTVFKILALFWM